ncbi:MAG TPA: hypothetical protein VFT34_09250 [Verrucomicrobiae bacterium]|nr:hypothetical protein [Verrucomicrobiae bacterium]
MNRPLQQLIDALREELQQCGEMLAQLDEPARLASANSPGADWPGQPRADALLAAREAREFSWQQLAWAAQKPQAVSIGELIPCLPRDHQPLVGALVEENESLWRRVYLRLHQDFCWLDRARRTSRQSLDLISSPDAATAGLTRPPRVSAA